MAAIVSIWIALLSTVHPRPEVLHAPQDKSVPLVIAGRRRSGGWNQVHYIIMLGLFITHGAKQEPPAGRFVEQHTACLLATGAACRQDPFGPHRLL
jgi:hypothetical protein